jgi:hypothetical protein
MQITFNNQSYYPALRTRPAEMIGYQNLSDIVKNGLLPIFALGSWPRTEGLDGSLQAISGAIGDDRPKIIDLTRDSLYRNERINALLDPSDNFKRWRNFVVTVPNAIPVVQLTADARLTQIIRQTREFENAGLNKLCFRITDFVNDAPKIITALAAMDSPQNALIIIDAGYIRETMAASIFACIKSINEIRDEIPTADITVLSNSYPSSVAPFANSAQKLSGAINIMERDLHDAIGVDAAIYGDHGSIHARIRPATGGTYTPHIDCALYDAWIFERRPGEDAQGYISAAQSIVAECPDCIADNTWGGGEIRRAAGGDIEKLKTRAAWISVKVNMHLTRQFELSEQLNTNEPDEN